MREHVTFENNGAYSFSAPIREMQVDKKEQSPAEGEETPKAVAPTRRNTGAKKNAIPAPASSAGFSLAALKGKLGSAGARPTEPVEDTSGEKPDASESKVQEQASQKSSKPAAASADAKARVKSPDAKKAPTASATPKAPRADTSKATASTTEASSASSGFNLSSLGRRTKKETPARPVEEVAPRPAVEPAVEGVTSTPETESVVEAPAKGAEQEATADTVMKHIVEQTEPTPAAPVKGDESITAPEKVVPSAEKAQPIQKMEFIGKPREGSIEIESDFIDQGHFDVVPAAELLSDGCPLDEAPAYIQQWLKKVVQEKVRRPARMFECRDRLGLRAYSVFREPGNKGVIYVTVGCGNRISAVICSDNFKYLSEGAAYVRAMPTGVVFINDMIVAVYGQHRGGTVVL